MRPNVEFTHYKDECTFDYIVKKYKIDILSREFSKYFQELNFGDYVRKKRIEKAVNLIENTSYTLTEIAYMTGFSDQSHLQGFLNPRRVKIHRRTEKKSKKSNQYTKRKKHSI